MAVAEAAVISYTALSVSYMPRNTWYHNNKERHQATQRLACLRHKEWLDSLKANKSCKCGESNPFCLDWHHRNPDEKSFCISRARNCRKSRATILEEIAKCDLVCANCHRKIHFNLMPKKDWKNQFGDGALSDLEIGSYKFR
jgi:hypothetical protein